MNNTRRSSSATLKLRLQATAFLLIVLSSLGLYLTVASGLALVTWLLIALIAGAMILAACAS